MPRKIEQIKIDFVNMPQNKAAPNGPLDFYCGDDELIELPDAATLEKAIKNLNELKEAANDGKKVVSDEKYDVLRSFTTENALVLEAIWTGTLAMPIGDLAAGGEMKAYFARLYDFNDRKVIKQRNYDCFEVAF